MIGQKHTAFGPRSTIMGTETFYATAAQVLPTVLIALVIEIGAILRAKQAAYDALFAQMDNPPPYKALGLLRLYPEEMREYQEDPKAYAAKVHHNNMDRLRTSIESWNNLAKLIAGVFIAGEALAFAAIGYRWFNAWVFFGVAACLLALCVAAVLIPLFRLEHIQA
ncbi:hypothetical protein ACBJ59_57055 [Nonomuraea sp. MTCD27]|uniref:hypothetical protein n=1 Tax=Nonomuraea sp. MTCD27 TaxID=1676747 RepID=UPI0035BF9A01